MAASPAAIEEIERVRRESQDEGTSAADPSCSFLTKRGRIINVEGVV
jgi:hypothetical protein